MSNDVVIAVAEWALTGALAVIATALYRQLKRMKTETDALKRGMQMQLRADLINIHHVWIADKGYMPVDVKTMWFDMYRAYEALGTNGVIEGLYHDVQLAHVAPDPDDEK